MSADALRSAGFSVREGVPFAELTTLGVGGPCARLVDLDEPGRLGDLLGLLARAHQPVFVLGGGSNLLVSDAGYDGTAVKIVRGPRQVTAEGDFVHVRASAGEDWSGFVEWCVGEGLSGVECLSGVPGTVGASPVQNVGAYGQEIATTVRFVHAWDRLSLTEVSLRNGECEFSYRDSIFKRTDRFIVTAVDFVLERSVLSAPIRYDELARVLGVAPGARVEAADVARAVLGLRKAKGMVLSPLDPDARSAGSFFTNPLVDDAKLRELRRLNPNVPFWPQPSSPGQGQRAKVPAAWLIENAGFARGYTRGRAAISTKHTLALVARDGATASDIVGLAVEVRDGVEARFGIRLQPEPVLLGLSM
jgi:UDP-N-acetylmuramate dehydrogenase